MWCTGRVGDVQESLLFVVHFLQSRSRTEQRVQAQSRPFHWFQTKLERTTRPARAPAPPRVRNMNMPMRATHCITCNGATHSRTMTFVPLHTRAHTHTARTVTHGHTRAHKDRAHIRHPTHHCSANGLHARGHLEIILRCDCSYVRHFEASEYMTGSCAQQSTCNSHSNSNHGSQKGAQINARCVPDRVRLRVRVPLPTHMAPACPRGDRAMGTSAVCRLPSPLSHLLLCQRPRLAWQMQWCMCVMQTLWGPGVSR